MSPEAVCAALITPLGEGGIGVIAVWGAGAVGLLDAAFVGTRRSASELAVGELAHGSVRGPDGAALDEALLARPDSAAGASPSEPYFEVNCHGGVVAVRAVLARLEELGARTTPWRDLAVAPDEALPLSQAAIRRRALAALADVPTRLGALMLLHQAQGALSREVTAIEELAAVGQSDAARRRLDALLATAPLGRALLHPPGVALIGPPNVGKSTLFNALFRQERVIVRPEPGTTRDVVREVIAVRGVPFEIMDAAGIRETSDEVEREAVRRAEALVGACDVALLIYDVREGPAGLPAVPASVRSIRVANKADLLDAPPRVQDAIVISAKTGLGLDRLEEALLAPYSALLGPCRDGAACVFDAIAASALTKFRRALVGRPAGHSEPTV